MITFLGKTVQNFFTSLKYILRGNMRFEHVVSQAASISYDSLPISLIISVINILANLFSGNFFNRLLN